MPRIVYAFLAKCVSYVWEDSGTSGVGSSSAVAGSANPVYPPVL